MTPRKKLIEVALPLEAINREASREKSIRHGHPSTLHLWWARRPLAAARAVIFAQMVDDPSAWPELFPTKEDQDQERQRLFRLIKQLVKWENTTNEDLLRQARDEIWKSWRRTCSDWRKKLEKQREQLGEEEYRRLLDLFNPDKLPAFHDPFAGGGSLPLEAQRLGLEAYASDLNPVAVLINKAMIEIPPRFANRPPVNPEARAKYLGEWPSRPHRGWYSRGYLPHCDKPGLVQSITFRLHDSVPREVLKKWKTELGWHEKISPDDPKAIELRKRIARYEDQGYGACWLANEKIAQLIEDALLHFDGQRYRLLAWCIMPNHVHVLIETIEGFPLGEIVHSWKSFTAHKANHILKRKGIFWMPEYFDRFIRNEEHLKAAIEYIENNPVKAGLVKSPEQWRFSSAGRAAVETTTPPGASETLTPPGGGFWKGAAGLAEDVRYYGQWMRREAEKRIGHLYPKVKITEEMVKERPDLKPYLGRELTVIAWLWARTVRSPNPAFADVQVPLISTFMLSTKKGKEAYVEPVIIPGGKASGSPAVGATARPGYVFKVKVGKPPDPEAAKMGTKLGRGANFRCLLSGVPMSPEHIHNEFKAKRAGVRLMAIVAEGDRGRIYLSPTHEHEAIARKATPSWKPEIEMNPDSANLVSGRGYGFKYWHEIFTPRQLVALTTFSDLVQEAMQQVEQDALAAGLPDDGKPLREGGRGARAYAEAVGVYLAESVSKLVTFHNQLAYWRVGEGKSSPGFGRQAIPMTWDFTEVNPFAGAGGDFEGIATRAAPRVIAALPALPLSQAAQMDAAHQGNSVDKIISTDPPYYDNIGYADLSDFFYIWLRRSLKPVFPDLFGTVAVPKTEELVATPYRHNSKNAAEQFFLEGMLRALQNIARQAHPGFPVTIYYAFKQSEKNDDGDVVSTGWETFLDAVIQAGFAISGTWPMRTEREARSVGIGTNALASSIVLVCRKRSEDAPVGTRREFLQALKTELPQALRLLQQGNIAPVDLQQAAIGPGMAVFTRYSKVLDAAGTPLQVRDALTLINQVLDEVLAEQEGDFDADTRWAIAWYEQFGFSEGDFGAAETLTKAKNTSVEGLVEAGVLQAQRGKVRLLRPEELPEDWDPATDQRLTVWEAVHHLIRRLENGGENAAAELLAQMGSWGDTARELAYRLFVASERKQRAREALAYNALVQSWPEIARLARERQSRRGESGTQTELELE